MWYFTLKCAILSHIVKKVLITVIVQVVKLIEVPISQVKYCYREAFVSSLVKLVVAVTGDLELTNGRRTELT